MDVNAAIEVTQRAVALAYPRVSQWVLDQPIQANIAIETDYEYYSMFQSAADPKKEATNYMALLIGCESW